MMILANDWAIREHTDPPMSEMLPTATRVEASPEENQSKSIVSIFRNNNLESKLFSILITINNI